MFASRDTRRLSDGDDDRRELRAGPSGEQGLLVLGPQSGSNGLLDVLDRFLLVDSLRNASRQSRTFRHETACLVFLEGRVKQHGPASIEIVRYRVPGEMKSREPGVWSTFYSLRGQASPAPLPGQAALGGI